MPNFYSFIDLQRNELRQAQVQNLASPGPTTPVAGQLWYDSTNAQLKWYNGTAWVVATGGGSLTPASTVTTQAVGDTGVVGVSVNYAREDHKHGREAFGSPTAETTFGTASAVGVATSLVRSDHTHGNPVHDDTAHAGIHLNALALPTAAVQMNAKNLSNVAYPVVGADAATKNYVDDNVQGLSWKSAVRVASTANLALTGLVAVDGVTVAANDRVLVKNQTTPSANGIYTAASGAWVRSVDADIAAELLQAAVFVQEGTTLADTGWVCSTNAPITLGTTSLTFVQFTGAGGPPTGAASGDLTGTYPGPTIAANVVDNTKLAGGVAQGTFKARGSSGSGNYEDLTAAQATVQLALFTAALRGLVPPSGGGTTTFLRADGTFAAPPAGTVLKYAAALTGTASPETVTHNLNTRDVTVTVLNGASPYTAVEVDWDATTLNTVTIRYNPNLGAGYRIVITG